MTVLRPSASTLLALGRRPGAPSVAQGTVMVIRSDITGGVCGM